MLDVIAEFEKRAEEVERYMFFLEAASNQQAPNLSGKLAMTPVMIDSELNKILKANTYLLLYNLMESSMRMSLRAIHEKLKTEGVGYDDLKAGLKKHVFLTVRNRNADEFVKLTSSSKIAVDLISNFEYKFDNTLSGNLDARKIRLIAKTYEFSDSTDKTVTKDGLHLLQIKERRNDLAHGDLSFSDCGRDITTGDLQNLQMEVVTYVRQILHNIKVYLDNKEYQIAAVDI